MKSDKKSLFFVSVKRSLGGLIIGLLVVRLCSPPILSAAEGLVLPSFPLQGMADPPLAESGADDSVLSGYTEAGRRSTGQDYEEEDTDEDYTYQNYHLKFSQEVSQRLSYDLSTFIYDKDYKSLDSLDNLSRIFKTDLTYFLKKNNEQSLKLDFDLKYKEKRYKNSSQNEYDEVRFVPAIGLKENGLYGLDLSLGVDNFDYLAQNQKDQFKVFTKLSIERHFFREALRLISSYRIEQLKEENIGRKNTKQQVLAGLDYLFDLAWIYKLSNRLEWGERDTKDEEARDEDLDFEYWRYYTETVHRLNQKLKTELKFQYFKKDYLSSDLDHRGFYLGNNWDYELLDDEKQRLKIGLGLEHKDVNYHLKSGNDYLKETIEAGATYQRKKNYKLSANLEESFYNFNIPNNDKKRVYVRLLAEKLFLEGDLALSIDFKYIYTDYRQKDDTRQEAVRLAFRYEF